MTTDPMFYLVAIPAVLLYGIGKGGLGGALGALAVPMMALAVDPVHAAAILLPIICVMDIHVMYLYRGNFDKKILKIILPASLTGVLLGVYLMGTLQTANIKLLLGAIAVIFCLQHWLSRRPQSQLLASNASGYFWGAIAGFTSTHIHAGGPPISVYLLNKNLDKFKLVGTMGVFFAVLNYVKLVPYTYLGQFDQATLITSLVLLPLAPIGVRIGSYMIHRLNSDMVYRIIYVLLFISGGKLLYDGSRVMLATGQ